MPKYYKVKVIAVLLKNNKTANSGDVISEDQVHNADQMVEDGYLALTKDPKKKQEKNQKVLDLVNSLKENAPNPDEEDEDEDEGGEEDKGSGDPDNTGEGLGT